MAVDKKKMCRAVPDVPQPWPPDTSAYVCFYEKGHKDTHRNANGDEWE